MYNGQLELFTGNFIFIRIFSLEVFFSSLLLHIIVVIISHSGFYMEV